jgi:uncharacterized protein YbaA (DUF1428 family)
MHCGRHGRQGDGFVLAIGRCKDDETVVFAWIVFESRASRDEVNAKVLADPRLKDMCEKGQMPLNYKRMAYGGFETLVEA